MRAQGKRRILSLCGVGSKFLTAAAPGYRLVTCLRCASVIGVDEKASLSAPVECCVCSLVFYPAVPCAHNAMRERPNDTTHAWECADCGYIYGSETSDQAIKGEHNEDDANDADDSELRHFHGGETE